jgi:hypothetical protein
VPIIVFFVFDYAIDLTVPLIATLVYPRAQVLYYKYVDNVAVVLRKAFLRGCPPLVMQRYVAIFEASSLSDRLAASLHAAGIVLRYGSYLYGCSSDGLPKTDRREKRLRQQVAELRKVYRRCSEFVDLQKDLRDLRARKMLPPSNDMLARACAEPGTQGEGTSGPEIAHMAISLVPRNEWEQLYEMYFLEVMASLNAVLAACRPFFADPRSALWFECSPKIDGNSRIVVRECVVHRRKECFVPVTSGQIPDEDRRSVEWYAGNGPECFFASNESTSNGGENASKGC